MAESPTYDARFDLASIMGIVDGTTGADQLARPGQRVYVVDMLSQPWQELLNGIRFWQTETWRGEKLSTLCYRFHGTENTGQIVLAFNGLGTPMEMRPGMTLRIPLKSELDRLVSSVVKTPATGGVIGRLVTI